MTTHPIYDQVPYNDCPIVETSIDHLYTLSCLFGLTPQRPDNARVLEIGCANGSNLIPLAYHWPDSTFVGIELAKNQAENAQSLITNIGLRNAQVIHDDVINYKQHNLREFDYIIAHGVYSWVPQSARDAIMDCCRSLLKPNGIAYISYNTRPGWDMRGMLAGMLNYHQRKTTSEYEKIERSQNLLAAFANSIPDTASHSELWLKQQAIHILEQPPGYLLHDLLERHNHPVYFHEFVEHAATFELQYVTDSNLYTVMDSTLSEHAQGFLEQFDNVVEYEQHIDFFYLKHFRQSLLCRQPHKPDRDLQVELLKDANFFANLKSMTQIDFNSHAEQIFITPTGDHYALHHPLVKAMAAILAWHYPNALTYQDLYNACINLLDEHGNSDYTDGEDQLFIELLPLLFSNVVRASMIKREFETDFEDPPRVSDAARQTAVSGRGCIATVHHNSVILDSLDSYLMQKLDGRLRIDELVTQLMQDHANDPAIKKSLESVMDTISIETVENYLRSVLQFWSSLGIVK